MTNNKIFILYFIKKKICLKKYIRKTNVCIKKPLKLKLSIYLKCKCNILLFSQKTLLNYLNIYKKLKFNNTKSRIGTIINNLLSQKYLVTTIQNCIIETQNRFQC